MDAIKYVQEQMSKELNYPAFRPGDNIIVSYKIVEGAKERIQAFRGDVIQINGEGATKTFTVRKMSNGVGVERIFPFAAPGIVEIKVLKRGKVRRSKLYYLRSLVGKKARIK
ncbi:MAG: 50S ribosomal protein L19, partial [Bacteroidota bacterium]